MSERQIVELFLSRSLQLGYLQITFPVASGFLCCLWGRLFAFFLLGSNFSEGSMKKYYKIYIKWKERLWRKPYQDKNCRCKTFSEIIVLPWFLARSCSIIIETYNKKGNKFYNNFVIARVNDFSNLLNILIVRV